MYLPADHRVNIFFKEAARHLGVGEVQGGEAEQALPGASRIRPGAAPGLPGAKGQLRRHVQGKGQGRPGEGDAPPLSVRLLYCAISNARMRLYRS